MEKVQEKTQVSFKIDPQLLQQVKEVLKIKNITMTAALNTILQNIAAQKSLPFQTKEELENERLIAELCSSVNAGFEAIQAGNYVSHEELRAKLGI